MLLMHLELTGYCNRVTFRRNKLWIHSEFHIEFAELLILLRQPSRDYAYIHDSLSHADPECRYTGSRNSNLNFDIEARVTNNHDGDK